MPNEQLENFTNLLDGVLSVPREEILRREAKYKKQSEQNPHKRGPKANKKAKKVKLDDK